MSIHDAETYRHCFSQTCRLILVDSPEYLGTIAYVYSTAPDLLLAMNPNLKAYIEKKMKQRNDRSLEKQIIPRGTQMNVPQRSSAFFRSGDTAQNRQRAKSSHKSSRTARGEERAICSWMRTACTTGLA